eukprot:5674902-Amphidinium_carterae.1
MMGLRKRMAKARQEGMSIAMMQQMKDEVDVPVTQDDCLEALRNVNRSVGNEDRHVWQFSLQTAKTVAARLDIY